MSKKTNIKQNKKKTMNKQKKTFGIVGFSFSIVLLVLFLLGALALNTYLKSDNRKLVNKFEEYYSSKNEKVIFYYDSTLEDLSKENYELGYIIKLSKDYNFEYLSIDKNLLNSSSRDKVELTLGISGEKFATAVVKDNKILAIQEGYIESHKLVEMFIKCGLLEKGSTYSDIDNLKFISYTDYMDLIETEKKQIIVLGQPACKYCISIKPIINNISKAYKVDIYYLDLADLKKQEVKELINALSDLGYDDKEFIEDEILSLPLLILFDDGKIKNYLKGANNLTEYVNFLKKNKYIE